jgi:hypothetical protein
VFVHFFSPLRRYHLKFRFWVQEYNASYHQDLKVRRRTVFIAAAKAGLSVVLPG